MKNKYKKVIYIFSSMVLISVITGVVRFSLGYIEDNPKLYIPQTKSITI